MMPEYIYTNESLEAIVRSLQLTRKDNVLAILGSGDQAFAMIEHANSVTAVDISLPQVQYASKQWDYIQSRKFNKFLSTDTLMKTRYFTEEKLDKISAKKGKINFVHNNIREIEFKQDEYSKIYLSNAVSLGFDIHEMFISKAAGLLRQPGLFYITAGGNAETYSLPSGTIIDMDLTVKARDNERSSYKWKPVVLKKIDY